MQCPLHTCSQNRQSIKLQNHETIINFVEKLYFFILYKQVYIISTLGIYFRENTNHFNLEGKRTRKLRYFLLCYKIGHTVHQVQLK